MASKQKRKVSRRQARALEKQYKLLRDYGFAPIDDTNPFENTEVYSNADRNTRARIRRHKTLGDIKRQQTFYKRYGITKEYDALTTVLGSAMFKSLSEKTRFDSNQVIEMFRTFGGNISAEQFEQAESMFETALSGRDISFVDETAYREALDAGFTDDEAIEYAKLVGAESLEVSRESVMHDIRRILRSNEIIVNNQRVRARTNFINPPS